MSEAAAEWLTVLFDRGWYLSSNADAAEACGAGADPLDHFLHVGARAGYSPHPLFDTKWYLAQNSDAMAAFQAGTDPLTYFLSVGTGSRAWPHPIFDTGWYLANNAWAAEAVKRGVDPLTHFLLHRRDENESTHPLVDALWYSRFYMTGERDTCAVLHFAKYGIADGNKPTRYGVYSPTLRTISIVVPDVRLGEQPLVSIIIVNLNGERHLEDLFASLRAQTYRNYEVVFVDNGSTDHSVERARALLPTVNVQRLDRNHGFSGANNVGLRASRGELVALLNNDTRVEPTWLERLVAVMTRNPNVAAATSKVRFWERFCQLEVTSPEPFAIAKAGLLRDLAYKKVLVREGSEDDTTVAAADCGDHHRMVLLLPCEGEARLQLVRSTGEQSLRVSSRYGKQDWRPTRDDDVHTYRWSDVDRKHARYVINNVGSYEPDWLKTADRGYGEIDHGQYDTDALVGLICGCAVIVRRDALAGEDLFIDEFVAYFEDSELSRRLRRRGFDLIYCSGATVYHKHASTSVERSAAWYRLVERNRAIYEYLNEAPRRRRDRLAARLSELNHQIWYFSHQPADEGYGERVAALRQAASEIRSMARAVDADHLRPRRQTRVGVFNNYWNTLGGGEAHALQFVLRLQDRYDVELLSEQDFDIDYIAAYFNVDLGKTRKRLMKTLTEDITAEYDVFINSTYMNECPSRAKRSFYVVSFPSKTPSTRFIDSYTFLPNSRYTLGWMKRYWGEDFSYKLIYPSVADTFFADPSRSTPAKGKVVLSVGRFFSRGHSKNQLVLAQTFQRILASHPRLRDWTLCLMGSVNDEAYFDQVRAAVDKENMSLRPNVSFEEVRTAYATSRIYVHAAGLGRNSEEEPENFEHFGMTVAEAAAGGCFPIVFDAAGPAEIIGALGAGEVYDTEDALYAKLLEAMSRYDAPGSIDAVSGTLRQAARQFQRTVARSDVLDDILSLKAA